MTRQWLAIPERMCRNHLLGEHFEAHIFVKKMEKSHSLEGFRRGSMFFGAEYVKLRHDILAEQIAGHKTPLEITDQMRLEYPLIRPTEKDFTKSLADLLGRCTKCKWSIYDG